MRAALRSLRRTLEKFLFVATINLQPREIHLRFNSSLRETIHLQMIALAKAIKLIASSFFFLFDDRKLKELIRSCDGIVVIDFEWLRVESLIHHGK
jgi:hypothetical protein